MYKMATSLVDEIAQTEAKLHEMKALAVRKQAEERWMKMKLMEQPDWDKACQHHESCKNVTYWLGRTGPTPAHTRALLPLPEHPQRPVSGNNTCPGCSIALWADCLGKTQ